MALMLFDEKYGISSSAVCRLPDKTVIPVLKVGNNITHKQSGRVTLRLDDNPLGLRPALRIIEKLVLALATVVNEGSTCFF